MTPIQVVAGLIAVGGVVRSLLLFRERRHSIRALIFWLMIWGGIGIIAFVPKVSFWISEPLGIQRGVDVIVYVSIILLFFMVSRLILNIESLERQMTALVRELALQKRK
mgnify:CR=1 FL=1